VGLPLVHPGQVETVSFSPDGETFAVAVWGDTAVRLYDTEEQQALGPPLQHPSRIWSLAFSPDSSTLITGCADGKARLWDTATGQPLGAPVAGKTPIRAVAFSQDGQTALAAEEGKVIRSWRVPPLHAEQPERIVLWTKVLTGMELDTQGAAKPVDAKTWGTYQKRLVESLGGPPEKLELSDEQIQQWHLQEAGECEATRQWFAARWHLNHVLEADPENPTLHDRRGRVLAELGEWQAAAADFRKAVDWYFAQDHARKPGERFPSNTDQWERYAVAALTARDTAGFRSFCSACVKLYGSIDDPQAMDRMDPSLIEKLTALALYGTPEAGDLNHLAKLAQKAVALDRRSPWNQLTLAAIQYRQQKYTEALQTLKNTLYDRATNEEARDQFLLSMVYRHLGNTAQAQAALAKGVQLSDQYQTWPWTTRQELLLLRREAEGTGG
jgi:Tfp pilus assembly protein PilF